jgi:class 3 adenylate cyclase/tetratricopeptide (TPR) repeat protein
MTTCPACGKENPDGFQFCGFCTAPLQTGSASRGQRKTVTVLFCDVTGSTELGESTDPEALRSLLARYFERMKAIVEAHGGTVEKFIGDAVMAVFGVPVVHEDDALRACRAALEMRDALPDLGVQARIGVNTGEVVTGTEERLATGDAVNVAARLEQAAQAGEVLIGEETRELVRDVIEVEPVEPLELKGKTAPVPAWRLLAITSEPTRRHETPMVGRERELQALRDAFARARHDRSCQLFTVLGAAGVGKSRLAYEFLKHLDATVVRGRCLSYGEGITYWPVIEVLKQLDALPSDPTAAASLCSLLGESQQGTSAEEIAWGFRKLLEERARERPLVCVFDDIHWAEETLLDLVEHIADLSRDAPILLLCMARPELLDKRPGWGGGKLNATTVLLEPLSGEETDALVDELGGLSGDLRERIRAASEGNPLFVEEMLALVRESKNGEVSVPPTIQALLAARLDQLDPKERSVLECGSVEGRVFHRTAVAALDPEETELPKRLVSLVRKELLRPDTPQLPGDDAFRFRHLLIRDAAYDALAKATRAELHERFAAWLEARMREETPDEIVGYHLEQAHRYRVELGQEDDHARRLALRAGRLLADAGRRAHHARLDITATRSLLSRAAELLPTSDPEHSTLLMLLGRSHFEAGEMADAIQCLREAQCFAAEAGERGVELRARARELGSLATVLPRQKLDEAVREARAIIAELDELGDRRGVLDGWWLVAQLALGLNDMKLREEAARHSLELARELGLRREAAEAARLLGFALVNGMTPVDEALPQVEQAFADAPEEPAVPLGLIYAFAGRSEEAAAVMVRARDEQLQLGKRLQHAADSMDFAWAALVAGRPAWAEPELRAGAAVLKAAGDRGWLATVEALLAEALYRLGRYDEADEWARRSTTSTQSHDSVSQALWRTVKAKLLARRGEEEEAIRLAATSVEQARLARHPHLLGDSLTAHAEVFLLLGRREDARQMLEEALKVYERKGIVPSIERTRRALEGLQAAEAAL